MASWRTIATALRRVVGTPVPATGSASAWTPVIREPYTGAWQRNVTLTTETALAYAPVHSCVDLISSDVAKVRLRLVEQSPDGIWLESENSAYSPTLRRPNRYQTPFQFVQQWLVSKLTHGNTYTIKQRDARGVVSALYVLDPTRVTPLVTAQGDVYYQLDAYDLAGLLQTDSPIVAPASEIIHDRMMCPFHPLCGVSPIFAAALAANQGLMIQRNSELFFRNASQPGGVLMIPGRITQAQADERKNQWRALFGGDKYGDIAILQEGMKYEPLSVNATDAQLIEQLKWTGETICSVFHVPCYMVQIGPPPPYADAAPLVQLYYSQCIQRHFVSFEQVLDWGLEFPRGTLGTEFDIDDLIWMDAQARTEAATKGIGSGGMSPNEARKKYLNLPATEGGESPYLQQQNYSLGALAERDRNDPFKAPAPPAPPPEDDDELEGEAISDEAAKELRVWWEA